MKTSVNCDFNGTKVTHTSRIINIKLCGSPKTTHSKLPTLINDSSYVFIVEIEVNEANFNFDAYHEQFSTIFEGNLKRSIIINYYNKHDDKESIKFIGESKKSTQLLSNKFIDSSRNHSEMMRDALRNDCTLCIRLTQLLSHDANNDFQFFEHEIAEMKCDFDCFRALLDLPYNFDFTDSYNDAYDVLHSAHMKNMKLSWSDAEYINENFTIDDFLHDKDLRSKCGGLTALAWSQKKFQIFYFLIRADCAFSQNFIDDRTNSFDYPSDVSYVRKLEKYIKEIEKFHKNIRNGNFQKVQNFLSFHQNLTFARDVNNESALKVALDSKNFKIFTYIKSIGMFFGDLKEFGHYYAIKNQLGVNKKKQIRQLNRRFIKPARSDVIEKLIDRSFVFYDPKVLNIEQINAELRRIYADLNEYISEVLTIASASSHLEIIFDFDNSQLGEIDPDMYNNVGAAYSFHDYLMISGLDFISDDEKKRDFALGTLAHELFHHATYQVYGNTFSPYVQSDRKRIKEFENIFESTRLLKDEDKLIKTAYDSDPYEEYNHGELIARVPDILLTNRHNLSYISEAKRKFKELFYFYEDKVLKDFRKILPIIIAREKVREFNEWFNVLSELSDIIEEDENKNNGGSSGGDEWKILKNITDRASILFTDTLTEGLLRIYREVIKENVLAVYVKSSFGNHGNFKKVMFKIDAIHPSVTIIIECDDMSALKKFNDILERTNFEKIIAVAYGLDLRTFESLGIDWAEYDLVEIK